jgi:hypothetical protein
MKNQQNKTSGVRWIAALGAVALLAVGAGSAVAGPVEGMQAHVDKAGKLRQPNPAEVKALADAFRSIMGRSTQGVQVTEHSDGSISATLGAEALNIWVATVNADGSISQTCVEGINAAATAAAPALEEK